MDVDELDQAAARLLAQEFLLHLQTPRTPLSLAPDAEPIVRSWCYAFFWNSVRFLETRDPMAMVAGNGPIVVPVDGSEPFVLPTYAPAETLLDEYEREHGLSSPPSAAE